MPIVGSGDVASVLPNRDDLIFFASGVSNSQETRQSEYQREVNLLQNQPRTSHIVYFSTLAIFHTPITKASPYVRHKLTMEHLIKKEFPKYTIIRIGNIDWGTNPHTLINYLRAHPEAEIRDEWRYVVDKDEFLYWVNLIPEFNVEMNIVGERMKVKQIKGKYA